MSTKYTLTVLGDAAVRSAALGNVHKPFKVVSENAEAVNVEFEANESEAHALKQELERQNSALDFALQPSNRLPKRLVVFDMDSTLIMNECIDLIARRAGVEERVAAITERAMRGELDFQASLRERAGLLKGVPTTIYDDLKKQITFTPGARELCAVLKKNGVVLAVLSGGFQPIADWVKQQLGLDYAFANQLGETNNQLTGEVHGQIVDGARKAQLVKELAAKHSIPTELACAVGDGSNDLPMMATAGFGIAWHAKPLVQEKAPSRLNGPSLALARHYMGYGA